MPACTLGRLAPSRSHPWPQTSSEWAKTTDVELRLPLVLTSPVLPKRHGAVFLCQIRRLERVLVLEATVHAHGSRTQIAGRLGAGIPRQEAQNGQECGPHLCNYMLTTSGGWATMVQTDDIDNQPAPIGGGIALDVLKALYNLKSNIILCIVYH